MDGPASLRQSQVPAPQIPNHTLYTRIGVGSYGEVWLGRDVMHKWRAIKIIERRGSAVDGQVKDHSYDREFRALKHYEEISHKDGSLMRVVVVGRDEQDRFFYYSMELADDLRTNAPFLPLEQDDAAIARAALQYHPKTMGAEVRRQGRLNPSTCIEYALALASALEQVHAAGLLHRDIKPDNIIFVHGRPKLADIGLMTLSTGTLSFAGTMAYLPPEGPRSSSSDVYALGMVLYEMVTGRRAEEFPALPQEFPSFSRTDRTAFNELNGVILKACEREISARYSSVREFREDLVFLRKGESVLRLRELEQREARREREAQEQRIQRRRRVRFVFALCATLAVALLIVVLALVSWISHRRAIEQNCRRELRELEISWMRLKSDGWFSNYWARLAALSEVAHDRDQLVVASSLLSGLDATALKVRSEGEASSAGFSDDGRLLISSPSSPVLLLETNHVEHVTRGKGAGPVDFTTNGMAVQLTVAGSDLALVNLESGEVLSTFSHPDHRFDGATVLALGAHARLAAACSGNHLLVWNPATNEKIGEAEIAVTAVGFSADGSLLAVGTHDGITHIFSTGPFKKIAILNPALRGNPIRSVAFGRDPGVPETPQQLACPWLLATGDQGGGITIWDLSKRVPRCFCYGSTWTVNAVTFSPDGMTLASSGRNQPRLWDIATGRPLLELSETSSGASAALAFNRTGDRLVTGGLSDGLQARTAVWGLEPHRGIRALRGLTTAVRKVWLSRAGDRVAALSDDWHLCVWDLQANRLMFNFETPVGRFADNAGGAFERSGERFVFAAGHEARRYNLGDGIVSKRWQLEEGNADQVQIDEQNRVFLLRTEKDGTGRELWRLYALRDPAEPFLILEQSELKGVPKRLAFSPDAATFAVWQGEGDGGTLHLYDREQGREIWSVHVAGKTGNFRVYFDPSGNTLAYDGLQLGRNDWGCRLVSLVDFRQRDVPWLRLNGVAPLGAELAAVANTVLIFHPWDNPGDSLPLATESLPSPETLSFSSDGQQLVWGTASGIVSVADLAQVKRRLTSLGRGALSAGSPRWEKFF